MPSAADSSSARASPWRFKTSSSARRVAGSVSREAVSNTSTAYGFRQRPLRNPRGAASGAGAAEAAEAPRGVRQVDDRHERALLDPLDHQLGDAIAARHLVRLDGI